MVEIYESEQEQIDAIKNWWSDNGRSVIIGIVLGIVVLLSYNGWQRYKTNRDEGASSAFYSVSQAVAERDFAKVQQLAAKLVSDYPSTHYASLAQFSAALADINLDNSAGAAEKLTWVTQNAKSSSLANIAFLRLAQVQIDMGKLDAAKQSLQHSFPAAYQNRVAELTADIAVADGDIATARKLYQQVLDNGSKEHNQATAMLVKLKLDDLGQNTAKPAEQ